MKQNKQGYYLSTKHAGRGIGLSSVRSIAERYNALLEIDHRNRVFSVKALLLSAQKSHKQENPHQKRKHV